MKKQYKTVWLSDIHLGCKDCKAEYLLDFLNNHQFETIYLVGDIVDMWAMSKQFRWPDSHNQVLHKIWQLSQTETTVIYLPGNHDQPLQKYNGMEFGHIKVLRETIHVTQDDKKLLVLHGDQFDEEVCFGPFHAWIGDKAYDLLLFINRWFNRIQTFRGKPYWSLAGHIKKHIKGANLAIDRYKQACCNRAKSHGLDGVICGHIHHPEICSKRDVIYFNDGDWIENCSALTENEEGHLELVYWTNLAEKAQVIPIKQAGKSKNSQAA
ncbi:MAG: UDP-2,3-diacylglucosamine diphosphatase [Aliiglaciecola sp.]|uniref:UDP-2,3-diacylglucosamine diphosphatase n=1 Tax=Aliiglaciecola sp. TaxID=1872441 RepID=UPI0032999372